MAPQHSEVAVDGHKPDITDLIVYVVFASSLGGLAALLRENRAITWREIVGSLLNSAMIGGVLFAMAWHRYGDDEGSIWFLAGLSVLAGMGGTSFVGLILEGTRKIAAAVMEAIARNYGKGE